jgi:hypothetical protein
MTRIWRRISARHEQYETSKNIDIEHQSSALESPRTSLNMLELPVHPSAIGQSTQRFRISSDGHPSLLLGAGSVDYIFRAAKYGCVECKAALRHLC